MFEMEKPEAVASGFFVWGILGGEIDTHPLYERTCQRRLNNKRQHPNCLNIDLPRGTHSADGLVTSGACFNSITVSHSATAAAATKINGFSIAKNVITEEAETKTSTTGNKTT